MSTLFDTHRDRAAELLRALSAADVARELGVAERTIKGWLSRGRADAAGKYGGFARAVDAARAERELPPRGELPVDAGELRLVVSRAARKGNVQAMRLAAELLAADAAAAGKSLPDDPLAACDELAARRKGSA